MLSKALSTGELGIEVVPPAWAITAERDDHLQFTDDRRQHWWYFWRPQVQFDVTPGAPFESLRARIERYARAMFIESFAEMKAAGQISDETPRTDDATWSPVIEATLTTVANQPALQLIHRMAYAHGLEMLLGHTIIPTVQGTLEVRWMNAANFTGIRESAALINSGTEGFLGQAEYDAPSRDASFPEHPLSMSRVAARWHLDAVKRVEAPTPFSRDQLIETDAGRWKCRLPSGFGPSDLPGWFSRLSFCCTDGQEQIALTAYRRPGFFSRKRTPRVQVLEDLTSLGAAGAVSDLSVHGYDGIVIEEPSGGIISSTRTVALWREVGGVTVCVTMVSPKVMSAAEIAAECAETLATVTP